MERRSGVDRRSFVVVFMVVRPAGNSNHPYEANFQRIKVILRPIIPSISYLSMIQWALWLNLTPIYRNWYHVHGWRLRPLWYGWGTISRWILEQWTWFLRQSMRTNVFSNLSMDHSCETPSDDNFHFAAVGCLRSGCSGRGGSHVNFVRWIDDISIEWCYMILWVV